MYCSGSRPSRVAINIALGAVALFWLVPTISMMIISFRSAGLFEVSGWWKVFTTPSQLTLQNYKLLFTGGSSTALGGGVPSGFAPGSVLDCAQDLDRDQRARNHPGHGPFQPRCLFHRVWPVARPQRRVFDHRRAHGRSLAGGVDTGCLACTRTWARPSVGTHSARSLVW